MEIDRIVLRPPIGGQLQVAVFGALWMGILGLVAVGGGLAEASAGLLVWAVLLVAGGVFVSSSLRLRVIAEGDQLRVRNSLRERSVPRASIAQFVDHRPGFAGRMDARVAAVLDDGTRIDLRATQTRMFGRERRDRDLERLRAWLAAGTGT